MERLSLNRWASPWLRHQHVSRYRWASSFVKDRIVLDAACGTGYGAKILAGAGALRVDCVDRSLQAAEETRGLAISRTRTVVADVTRLPFPDQSYDVYVSFETLEHVRDDAALIGEARRILKPQGTFICSTPNRALLSPGHTCADVPSNPHHVREYDLSELDSLVRSHFSIIDFYGQNCFTSRHTTRLNRLGKTHPNLALRLHQIRKSLAVLSERELKHAPKRLPLEGEPEVFIAVCEG